MVQHCCVRRCRAREHCFVRKAGSNASTEERLPAQALAGETRQVLNTARPKITKFCMLSERNTGSNWVAALLKVASLEALC